MFFPSRTSARWALPRRGLRAANLAQISRIMVALPRRDCPLLRYC